ncbi:MULTISPECIES: sugar phosphate isomerase/epimerase family protein [Devosia]|uniref:sugar phosphate isomerase/epimerase family protein n=1 Tax=Devosia TaxID=46913 RepID=UPI000CE9696E|nr:MULTISPECIES: sugar phosphate isomerase/epimerase family protein [Devosia]AVF03416.1 sugar phosphate isomerase/epimerase [Devosia sp. I507]
MDTCITVWYWPTHERWFDEGMRRTLRWVKEAGFTHINWNPDAGYSYIYAPAEIDHIGQMIDGAGLKAWSVHGSNGRNAVSEVGLPCRETRKHFLAPVEWQRQAGLDLVRNRIALAERIGSPNVVMHFELDNEVLDDPDSKAAYYDTLHRSLEDLRPDCERSGVRIAIENLPGASLERTVEQLERVFERHPESVIGLCYDSGHAELVEKGGVTILETFRSRLITTHLHDNLSVRDDHLLPWDGHLDWERLTALIADSPCALPLNFETPYRHHGMGYSTTEPAFYARAFPLIHKVTGMVAKARQDHS